MYTGIIPPPHFLIYMKNTFGSASLENKGAYKSIKTVVLLKYSTCELQKTDKNAKVLIAQQFLQVLIISISNEVFHGTTEIYDSTILRHRGHSFMYF